jgi:hypothetical protein
MRVKGAAHRPVAPPLGADRAERAADSYIRGLSEIFPAQTASFRVTCEARMRYSGEGV